MMFLRLYPSEIISEKSFIANTLSYIEAKGYNLGLNKKISIDYNGDIKNYVDHKTKYGNISKDRLDIIIKTDTFKRKGHICNDIIEKYRDCQFRYMCLSNSDIYEKNKKFYKKSLCDYNPYSNTWKVD